MTLVIESRDDAPDDAAFVAAFASVPRTVRRAPHDAFLPHEGHWVGLLGLPTKAPRGFWLARIGGRIVGRVGANVSEARPGEGYVGLFEVTEDEEGAAVAAALLEEAVGFLARHDVHRAYGPVDLSTWYSYRFRIDSGGGPGGDRAFSWEPNNPLSYPEHFLNAGFVERERYCSQAFEAVPDAGVDMDVVAQAMRSAYEYALSLGYRFEPFSSTWSEVLPELYALGNECFQDNFLFEPISYEAFTKLYEGIGPRVDYRASFWLLDAEGQKQGFIFAPADGPYLVMKTVGVTRAARGKGLSTALSSAAVDEGARNGLTKGVGALIKRGNASEFLLGRPASAGSSSFRHDYALYVRELGG